MNTNEVRWRCRRSILELDVMMHAFFEKGYEALSAQDKVLFHELLRLEDPELADILLYQKKHHVLTSIIRRANER